MEVHLLGTAGYHPNEHRHTACMMLPEAGIIFDAGTGFFRVRDLIQTSDLHIFLSHCHLDHCVGLSFYIDVIHEKNVENIYVYAEASKIQAIQQHLFSEPMFPVKPDFHWVPIKDGTTLDHLPTGGTLQVAALEHPGGSLGFRIDWPDRSIAYITDTTAKRDAEYVSFIRDVSLLLHECHFPDGLESMAAKTGHSCLTPVAQVCRDANIQTCVIVHLNPMLDGDEPLDLNLTDAIFKDMRLGADRMVVRF